MRYNRSIPPHPDNTRRAVAAAAAALAFAFALVYLPSAGHGFVKDDFGWVARAPLRSASDAAALFSAPSGFYRPVVSASFSANWWMCGLAPRCYGVSNLILALGCAAAIFLLARGLGLSLAAALASSALWLFNFHGVNMAVLWISGRTALLAVLFAVAAAAAYVRRRPWLAAALTFAAMLSKEEAVLIPGVLLLWTAVERTAVERTDSARSDARSTAIRFALASVVVAAAYAWLRVRAGAFTPSTAPSYYRLDWSAARLASNLPAYLDRTTTFAAAVVLLWTIVCRPSFRAVRSAARPVVTFALLWWIGTLAITVFLPVRSSLYACLPSVGSALAAAAIISAAAPSVHDRRRRAAAIAGIVLPFALWPVYAARNRNAVLEAELSTNVVAALRNIAPERGEGAAVVLRDESSEKPSLDNAFGTLVQEAADLLVRPHIRVWIDPPPADAALAGLQPPQAPDAVLTWRDGRITRTR